MNQQAKDASALADALHKERYEKTGDLDAGNENTPEALESLENGVVNTVDTPPEPVVVDYETQYKVLQGKYNAEVPRLSKEIRDMNSTVQTLQTQLEEVKAAPTPEATDLEATDLNPEAYAEYGEEFETLAKMVKNMTAQVSALTKENTYLKDSIEGVENTQHQTTTNDFLRVIGDSVPDWKTINGNPDFISWLQDVEPITGKTRQVHLDDAADTLNADKVVSIFKEFNDSVAQTQTSNNQQNIARQAQPDSVQGSAPASEVKPFYTRRDIKQFYKEVALAANGKGPWVGKDVEVKAIEADIFAAAPEGRIVG